jgi:hypothetical protein
MQGLSDRTLQKLLSQLLVSACATVRHQSNGLQSIRCRGHRVRTPWPNVLLSLNCDGHFTALQLVPHLTTHWLQFVLFNLLQS